MKISTLIVFITMLSLGGHGQTVLEIDGSIRIGNHTEPNPDVGTLRWSGNDFEVWNGVIWASLTGNRRSGTVEDIEGNVYRTMQIGEQEWMVDNLRVKKYNNGNDILEVLSDNDWENLTIGALCQYDTTGSNYSQFNLGQFGYLYNGFAATDDRGICPSGWHVPTLEEWDSLDAFLGEDAGGQMKLPGFDFWDEPNEGATNESGFSALPSGGRRMPSGQVLQFTGIGSNAFYWSSTDNGSDLGSNAKILYSFSDDLHPVYLNKEDGLAIRCIKD